MSETKHETSGSQSTGDQDQPNIAASNQTSDQPSVPNTTHDQLYNNSPSEYKAVLQVTSHNGSPNIPKSPLKGFSNGSEKESRGLGSKSLERDSTGPENGLKAPDKESKSLGSNGLEKGSNGPSKPQRPNQLSCGIDPEEVVLQLGQAGRFHLRVYLLVSLAAIQVGLLHTTYIFLAADVPYRCLIPECEAANSTDYSPSWVSGALPTGGRQRRCFRKTPAASAAESCQQDGFNEELQPCAQWLYASHDTIVAEFNLACQEWKRTLVGTIHNIGMLVSLPILGYISDRWGRKRALILSCTLVGAVGSLKAFSISYEMYVIVEFLETIAGASAFPAAYILTIELLGQDKRVMTTAFLGIMLVIGGLSFALLAKTFHYWRTFILVVYPPSLLFISYIYFLPESIRWLLSKGRKEEAVEIIMRAAKMNKVTLSDETMKQLKEEKPIVEKKEEVEERGLWMQVLQSPIIMTRLAICSWWWITCTFVFYGLAINSVSLAGDKYTNYMLVVSVEVVAVVTNALVLDRVGRKRTLLVAYLVCGVACVAIAFVPDNLPWLSTLLYLLGKIAITQAFSGIYMYTSELFPTHARHSLLGFCSMVGRLGSIVAPQMPLLALYVQWLPSALFGSTALVAAALMMTTPETLNTTLPDTIQEAEQLAQQRPQQMTSRC